MRTINCYLKTIVFAGLYLMTMSLVTGPQPVDNLDSFFWYFLVLGGLSYPFTVKWEARVVRRLHLYDVDRAALQRHNADIALILHGHHGTLPLKVTSVGENRGRSVVTKAGKGLTRAVLSFLWIALSPLMLVGRLVIG